MIFFFNFDGFTKFIQFCLNFGGIFWHPYHLWSCESSIEGRIRAQSDNVIKISYIGQKWLEKGSSTLLTQLWIRINTLNTRLARVSLQQVCAKFHENVSFYDWDTRIFIKLLLNWKIVGFILLFFCVFFKPPVPLWFFMHKAFFPGPLHLPLFS